MSKSNNLTDFLTDVANAIREKKRVSGEINPQNFSEEIKDIKTEAKLEEQSVKYTSNGKRTVTPTNGKDGLSKITIDVAVPTSGSTDYKIQSKDNVIVTENNKETKIYPDSNYDYMDEVIVTTAIPMQEKSVIYNDNVSGAVIKADSGYGGLSTVTVDVNVPMQDSKSQNITTAGSTTITPSSGYKAMKKVVVTPVLESKSDTIKNNGTYSFTPSSGKCGLSEVTVNVDVPTSGGGESIVVKESEPKDVNFYDYDGTLLHSYTKAEAQALTALPAVPSAPEGLGLEDTVEWNYTLDQIKDMGVCEVGPIYSKSSGLVLVFDVPYDGFVLWLAVRCSAGNATVDWGDGSVISTVAGQGDINHTYTTAGRYIIKYDAENSSAGITVGASNRNVCRETSSSSSTDGFASSSSLVGAVLGNNCTLSQSAFYYCGLTYCIILKGVKIATIPQNAFSYCYQLKHITFPCKFVLQNNSLSYSGLRHLSLTMDGGDAIANANVVGAFSNCINLRRLVLPPADKATTLALINLANTNSLCQLVIKKGRSFTGTLTLRSLAVLDLTDYETVPTLANTLTLPTACKILVKSGLRDSFISATNWSSHKDKFVGV